MRTTRTRLATKSTMEEISDGRKTNIEIGTGVYMVESYIICVMFCVYLEKGMYTRGGD